MWCVVSSTCLQTSGDTGQELDGGTMQAAARAWRLKLFLVETNADDDDVKDVHNDDGKSSL